MMTCSRSRWRRAVAEHAQLKVVFVVADCCLQEREYNPYYGHVAAKLASLDRKYRVAMQFNLWDRMRQVADMKRFQMTNLALLTKFLIIEKAQSLGLLKVIEFADLDKANMKLLKIILTGILQSLESDQIFELFKVSMTFMMKRGSHLDYYVVFRLCLRILS